MTASTSEIRDAVFAQAEELGAVISRNSAANAARFTLREELELAARTCVVVVEMILGAPMGMLEPDRRGVVYRTLLEGICEDLRLGAQRVTDSWDRVDAGNELGGAAQ